MARFLTLIVGVIASSLHRGSGVEAHWAQQIRQTRNIGDFTAWKDHDSYQKALERVLKDLRPEPAKDASGG